VFIGANNNSELPDLGLKFLDFALAHRLGTCAEGSPRAFSTVFQLSR
jgi:hypothetical protein